jgi:hypothetical protein
MFGGGTNEVWSLSNANGVGGTPQFTLLAPSGTPPPPRGGVVSNPTSVFDVTNKRMNIFGGSTPTGLANDTWVLSSSLGPLYDVCLLYDPTKAVKSGSTIPIKLQLCDGTGNNLSSASITVHAVSITQTSTSISGPVEDSGNANPDNDFRFDSTLGGTGGYIFNLSTKGLTTGTYNLNFTVTGDSAVYAAAFQVK